jgi:hypothetical protein
VFSGCWATNSSKELLVKTVELVDSAISRTNLNQYNKQKSKNKEIFKSLFFLKYDKLAK